MTRVNIGPGKKLINQLESYQLSKVDEKVNQEMK